MTSQKLKKYVKRRANYCCGICGEQKANHESEVHHIIFKKNMGTDHPSNLINLCVLCHRTVHQSQADLSAWLLAKVRHQEEQVNPSITGLKYYVS
jgi:5-methylcytosine-specific restriction endonuclease McrA